MKSFKTRLKKMELIQNQKSIVVYFVEDNGRIFAGKHAGKNIKDIDLTNARIIPLEFV